MSFARRTAVLTASVCAASALAGASPAQAAVCTTSLLGPLGQSWNVQGDGAIALGLSANGGSAFDKTHGALVVDGSAFPATQQGCTVTATSVTYPAKTVDGIRTQRSVSVAGGQLRWLDTITNLSGSGKSLTASFRFNVKPSQLLVQSETGDAAATDDDHWSVHQSSGLFSFLQWGQENNQAIDPAVDPDDDQHGPGWKQHAAEMDDATLRYSQLNVGNNGTLRLLHVAGATGAQVSAATAAKDTAAPFAGYSKAIAAQIVNWDDDPDNDGVKKGVDNCPSVKGDQADGCQKDLAPAPPADPADPVNPPANPVDPGTTPADPGTNPIPGSPGPAADRTGPRITVKGFGKTVKRSTFLTGPGVKATVGCDEACRVSVKVEVRKQGSKKAFVAKTVTRQTLSTKAHSVRLKLTAPALKRLKAPAATIVIRATDAAGNVTTVRKTVVLKK